MLRDTGIGKPTPGLFWKVTLWGLSSKSQNYSKYYWNKFTEAQTQVKMEDCFWLDTDYCSYIVAGALRNTIGPSKGVAEMGYERNMSHVKEPRWPSGLRRWFNATPWETGFRIPPLPRAEFGRLTMEWHNWLVTPREGGRTQQLR